MKLKVNDQVIVVLGKDRGKTGKVEKVIPRRDSVVVGGVNVYKKHVKKTGKDQPGQIVELTKPLKVAKVQLICPKCHKPTRVGFMIEKGKKLRMCRKCKKTI